MPVSRDYGDPYYARSDGLAETRYVYLDGNDLPRRWRALAGGALVEPGAAVFRIGELGFGTGLAVLAAWALWRSVMPAEAVLAVTSFEAAPLPQAAMRKALGAWPELDPLAQALLEEWPEAPGRADIARALPGLTLEIRLGDARDRVPAWAEGGAQMDAWFLDGFAPARNPAMWEPALLATVAQATRPGGTMTTYSAAGRVRRALVQAGLEVARRPGFGVKREMLTAKRPAQGDAQGPAAEAIE
ncbi:MAG: tRNA (5-methylaminomethyl-2-thiouridine)(34)-methyltransferase MnmD [Pseudomonadota bacterium]